MVIPPGFEPELPTPKDDVLPLHHRTIYSKYTIYKSYKFYCEGRDSYPHI